MGLAAHDRDLEADRQLDAETATVLRDDVLNIPRRARVRVVAVEEVVERRRGLEVRKQLLGHEGEVDDREPVGRIAREGLEAARVLALETALDPRSEDREPEAQLDQMA